jgi:purine catabolism regulator
MLTVRMALQLPVLETATVVGGAAGLDRVIQRAHVVDIPGTDFGDWAEGLLLLTAGYGMRHNRTLQAEFVPSLVKQGVAGVVFATGWYFDQVPDVIVAAANEQGLPIVVVTPDVSFIAILERLYVDLLNEQFALDKRVDEVHEKLTRLVLEGRGLDALAGTLADILERSVLVEDASNLVLAAARRGPIDDMRQSAEDAGRTPSDTVAALAERGIYTELRTTMKPLHLQPMPEIGMGMERVVAPIIVGREVYGYIWILSGNRPLTRLDERAIETAATVAALALLKERAVEEAQQTLRGDFLAQLFGAEPAGLRDSALTELGHRFGYRFGARHQFLYWHSPPAEDVGWTYLAGRVDTWLKRESLWGLVAVRDNGLAVMLEADEDGVGEEVAGKLLEGLHTPGQILVIGVGRGTTDDTRKRVAYGEARDAAEIGLRLRPEAHVAFFRELGVLHWLDHLPTVVVAGNPYFDQVLALDRLDQRGHGELVATLEAYLDYGGALGQASELLGVHRNTLLYRVDKIEQALTVDLKDALTRLNLHVAVKAFRLRHSQAA